MEKPLISNQTSTGSNPVRDTKGDDSDFGKGELTPHPYSGCHHATGAEYVATISPLSVPFSSVG